MEKKAKMKPAQIMGYFWLLLGCVVLVGTFFIQSADRVIHTRDIVTNLIGSFLLIGIGLIAILSGRAAQKKEQASKESL
jgi:hypothetical protein